VVIFSHSNIEKSYSIPFKKINDSGISFDLPFKILKKCNEPIQSFIKLLKQIVSAAEDTSRRYINIYHSDNVFSFYLYE
jgi:hypothetical protein